MKGIFVTGTDTGIGKTIVSAVLARLLSDQGLRVAVMKPVTSGCIAGGDMLRSEDADLLAWAARSDAPYEDIAPYRLREPLAPSVAAGIDRVRIDFEEIAAAYLRISANSDFVIVEGAGGLMVPVTGGLLMADLAARLQLPLLVVARPNLGTVNHTLLTCFAARTMGLQVKGVVINRYDEAADIAAVHAPHLIASLSGAPVLGIFPDISAATPEETVEKLTAAVAAEPATRLMLREITA